MKNIILILLFTLTTMFGQNCPDGVGFDDDDFCIEGSFILNQAIDEFSDDETLVDESSTTLVTERAIKGYVDNSGVIPYITNEYNFLLEPLTQKMLTLFGEMFIPSTSVSIPSFDGTIDNVSVTSPNELELTITSGAAEDTYDIVTSNKGVLNTLWVGNGVDMLEVAVSSWLDLRLGGDTFTHGNGAGNAIRYRSGMSLDRDVDGMWFTGASTWSSWVKFDSLAWTRGQGRTIEWIFTIPTSSFMIGIGSDETDENVTTQYNQMEVEGYYGATNLSSLYGNNGTPGTTGYHSGLATYYTPYTVFKQRMTIDGEAGTGVFTLYGLDGAGQVHWNDISNVLRTVTIGGTLAPNAVNIMPSIIPRDGGAQRFIALRVQ